MPLKNTACVAQNRISKKTVLSMLNSPKVKGPQIGEVVAYTNADGITKRYRVYKVNRDTVELELGQENITVAKSAVVQNNLIFLDKLADDEWEIVSFDPKTRTVCIDMITASGIRHMTVILPELSF